ncbi:tRNA (adenosine(37)-N6)-threonylcarbamoyltransferase complex ATPase subunit type 1 TsaE [Candidatus Uhrbacteria bacterium RIFCSPHIGHO2_12_FULL_57_11]|uniref:tRNA threonylcarbamoyladenosine biosynthesis protein TsaE n=2 Tax=Candidatus Uhriibacteriota TaxID=1752732 RepID=A0A1F7UIY9_9BACT|nr:MAG: tRNA (adenosine(37)-N6)-threonylcarbamoyltransferase complex ATPase subunit type 1 TsaE [Candidatus Uhrbacteria bacterium RIFCSPHIGHO2_02_FULL_57_19]OGL78229.1 MAG: tRNA (adenosine(37)-N6)-threonylcarbamoyltransferase complex ATPase subunit type 1 TsaE [Candidatus Uhrbacteria bacterium RIFCSPHIGHO2_12_FULL_57_11]
MKKRIVSHSERETFAFAKAFAKTLRGGTVVGLIGDLGSGKTTFVRGLARALGIRESVRSPTFTLMHVHRIRNSKLGFRVLIHVDAYRLRNERELEEIGIGEFLGKPDTVVLIEWADRVRGVLQKTKKIRRLHFFHETDPQKRRIEET